MKYIKRHMEEKVLALSRSWPALLLTGPRQAGKTTLPDKRLVRGFGVLKKAPLQIGTSAILCTADQLGAFDRENLIVPIWMV